MIPTHLLANKGKHCKNPSWALPAAGPASCNGEMVLAPRVLNNILLLVCYSLLTSFLLLFALALGVVSEDSEATYTSPTMNWSSTAAKDFCLRHIQGDRLTFPCTPKTNSYIPSTSVKARRFQALLQIFDLSSRSSGN